MNPSSGLEKLIAATLVGAMAVAIPAIVSRQFVEAETKVPATNAASSESHIASSDREVNDSSTETAAAKGSATSNVAAAEPSEVAAMPPSAGVDAGTVEGTRAAVGRVAAWLSIADVKLGEKINRQCAVCHSFDEGGAHRIGPNLWDIVGAKQAGRDGYDYSDALKNLRGDWTFEQLDGFLAAPQDYAPGSRMTFPGLKRPADRAAVIAWLREQSHSPSPLPQVSAEDAAAIATATAPTEDAGGASEATASTATVAAAGEEAVTANPAAAPTTAESSADAAADTRQAAVPPAENLAELLKTADGAAGEKIAKKCAACHSFENGGAAKVGPNLWDIVGAKQARSEQYKYSDALRALGGEWTFEQLDGFLASPKEYAAGTKMTFPGIKAAADRAALIAWLRTLSESPQPLP